ncbi:MAG: aminoacyl-tRNA hydrolase [Bacteroidia bacterium]|nr:aminoacyl-tRNA hydrolase [Bacteroidia bacterium]
MKYLIAGLGNIGADYHETRHNIGFMVAVSLADKLGVSFEPDRLANKAVGKQRGRQLVIIQPTTYMNLSGKAIRYHLNDQKIPIENLIVITDDVALPFGTLRMRGKGSDGGHNGLKDIQEILGTQQYARIRFGIGSDFPKGTQVDFVLSRFSEEEYKAMPALLDKCVEGILSFINVGLERTMNTFNTKT